MKLKYTYRPAELADVIANRLEEHIDALDHTFEVKVARHSIDDWAVTSFVTVHSPDGESHRLRVVVSDIHQ